MIKDTLVQFEKTLGNMLKILDKAQEFCLVKKIEPSILLNSRLAPDQFHFTRQIQIASDTAKFMAAKLSNKTPPAFEDNEVTIEELKTRIEKTINYISGFSAADFKGSEDIRTTNPRMPGKFLPGNEYFFQHALPNFFFHTTTAYAILRHNGVDLGKKDFLGTINYRDL
jgi:hypothetical protein